MELAETAEKTKIWPVIAHRLRAENTWADDLTERRFEGFDRDKQWDPVISPNFVYLLDQLV